MAQPHVAVLEEFLKSHPEIKCSWPSSPQYPTERQVFLLSRKAQPLAIAHPSTAQQVSTLVQFLRSNGLKFTVRAGGHNLQGLSIEEGAVTIDMRAFTSVDIANDRATAKIGAGSLTGELSSALWDQGLATPTGSIPSVGYLGWAMYGGYGPFSSNWGLGVDQIVAATLVNATGDIVEADDTLLRVIRGAGGAFGIIIDITIRVYPLTKILTGTIIYDSRNIKEAFTRYNAAYRELSKQNIPKSLTLQQMVISGPQGEKVFGVSFMWSSEDTEEGFLWCKKIAALGSVIMNTVEVTTIPEWYVGVSASFPSGLYGAFGTCSVREMTPELTDCLGRALERLPADPGAMFAVHQCRPPSSATSDSVFASREPHSMLEMIGCAMTAANAAASERWALEILDDVKKTNAGNLLDHVYISLDHVEESGDPTALRKYFGDYTRDILDAKREYDPQNVFDLAIPRFGHPS